MTKKVISLLLAFVLAAFFAACGDKETAASNDSSSAVSAVSIQAASSSASETASSKEASSDTSSGSLKGYIDGVYYGKGYNLKVPQGYALVMESELMVLFSSENAESICIISSPNPTGETTIKQEDIEDLFSAQFAGSTVQDLKTVKIGGKDAYTCLLLVDVSNIQVYTYSALIPTKENIIVVSMGFKSKDKANVFQETIDSIELG